METTMEVLIDGVRYVPTPEPLTDKTLLAALDLRINSDAGAQITVRDYLRVLLETLWCEEEGFSGKRPFGNSGWVWELYAPLSRAGFIEGQVIGDDVNLTREQTDAAHAYVSRLIAVAFNGIQ